MSKIPHFIDTNTLCMLNLRDKDEICGFLINSLLTVVLKLNKKTKPIEPIFYFKRKMQKIAVKTCLNRTPACSPTKPLFHFFLQT